MQTIINRTPAGLMQAVEIYQADQKKKEKAAADDRPRMKAALLAMGFTEAQTEQVKKWAVGELEKRLPRIDALKAKRIGI